MSRAPGSGESTQIHALIPGLHLQIPANYFAIRKASNFFIAAN